MTPDHFQTALATARALELYLYNVSFAQMAGECLPDIFEWPPGEMEDLCVQWGRGFRPFFAALDSRNRVRFMMAVMRRYGAEALEDVQNPHHASPLTEGELDKTTFPI